MLINELKSKHKLIEIFCDLVQIPSPSLEEDDLIKWISTFFAAHGIGFELDNYKNIIAKIPATDTTKQPILLSAHMDVVGDFAPINLELENEFIQTDKKRTLGADDKAGVACALLLALELSKNDSIAHGGLEIVLTRDEERGMTGIKNLDFAKLNSKYILVLDADKLGQLLISGASYTNAKLVVNTKIGGHSGLDIQDKNRLNAVKLIADLVSKIPQGVFFSDDTGVITSINLGTLIGGNIQNTVSKLVADKIVLDDYLPYFMENSTTNVINTTAEATYSIRSANIQKEIELKELIQGIVTDFNSQYGDLARAEIVFSEHLPPFEEADDELILRLHTAACLKFEINQKIASFHAGAETHIYAQTKNAKGEQFMPFLVGMADVYNMHSTDEKINQKTLLTGYSLLKELFVSYNS